MTRCAFRRDANFVRQSRDPRCIILSAVIAVSQGCDEEGETRTGMACEYERAAWAGRVVDDEPRFRAAVRARSVERQADFMMN